MKVRIASLTIVLVALVALVTIPAAGQNEIYDNGPIDGNTDAWTINFGFTVSDTFTTSGSQVSGLIFAAWLTPGDVLQSVEVSIASNAFFGTTYFDQTVSFTQSGCTTNSFGFNICTETATFSGVNLNAGTYWLTLRNASVNTGDPIYWDENSGPSRAVECCLRDVPVQPNAVGTIPSESFTVFGYGCGDGGSCADGTASSTTPELGSLLLLGSGILGLAGILRRKLF